MAQDPSNRVPSTWEILQPSPPLDPASYHYDARIEVVQRLLAEQGFTDPDLLATHPFGAKLPEECSFIVEQAFIAGNYSGFVNATQYGAWLATKADHGLAYAFHRRILQHLQSRYRAERWALKAPPHMFHLQALLNEYPDARVIVTHRDLMKVLPSIASMATALNYVFSDPNTVDPIAIGNKVVTLLTHGVRHTMETRDRLARPQQFCDVRYDDLRSEPVNTVARIYAHFDIPFSDAAREAMTRYVEHEGKARHGHGRHRYNLSDYGFTEADIGRDFGPYIERYRISKEA
jgi:Sulfotransferase family